MKLEFRLATLDDRAALKALQWRASLNNPGDRDVLLEHPDAIELPDDHILSGGTTIATRNGQTVGFSVILPRDDGDAELDGLFVEPDIWKSGIGRGLVERAALQAAELGAKYLHVVGNPHAEGFYLALGFVTYGTFETRFAPAPLMRRPLA